MTKQEKIREGINMKAPIPQAINVILLKLLDDYDKYKLVVDGLSKGYVPLDEYLAQAIAGIMVGMSNLDVMIKVDGELPKYHQPWEEPDMLAVLKYKAQQDMLKAGYVAVEPLIKEER